MNEFHDRVKNDITCTQGAHSECCWSPWRYSRTHPWGSQCLDGSTSASVGQPPVWTSEHHAESTVKMILIIHIHTRK